MSSTFALLALYHDLGLILFLTVYVDGAFRPCIEVKCNRLWLLILLLIFLIFHEVGDLGCDAN